MLYLSGCVGPAELCNRRDLGVLLTPLMGNAPDLSRLAWGADTGCFAQPEAYDEAAYLAYLQRRPWQTNLFATAPDVVGDAVATWEASRPVLLLIREAGFKAALVAQDGIEAMPIDWWAFDCLFIGGSTEWKLSQAAFDLSRDARRRGKWVHWGRVNSLARLRLARLAYADSADGTYIRYAPDRLIRDVCRWLDHVNAQEVLV